MTSTFKGKNLLLWKQILSFKTRMCFCPDKHKESREKLFPFVIDVYLYSLTYWKGEILNLLLIVPFCFRGLKTWTSSKTG